MNGDARFEQIVDALRTVVAALDGAGVPYVLGGSMACWVHGGPPPTKDLDLAIRPADADAALAALGDAGMRPEHPPEDWLVKAWHDDVCVDLIFAPLGVCVDDDLLSSAPIEGVSGMRIPVMRLEDVLSSKLQALGEHFLDFEYLLAIARPIREQVDWEEVRARTTGSPYAEAFLFLLERLELIAAQAAPLSRR